MFTVPAPLPDDPATLQRLLSEALVEIEPLTLRITGLERARFGRRSEQLSDEALQRESEELEQSLAEQSAKLNAAAAALEKQTPAAPARPEPPKRNRGALPQHLPSVETVIAQLVPAAREERRHRDQQQSRQGVTHALRASMVRD